MKTTFWDGKLKEQLLGNYVYALVDPKDDSVFYVGLAGGLEGKGNNRPDHHLEETTKASFAATRLRTSEQLFELMLAIRLYFASKRCFCGTASMV